VIGRDTCTDQRERDRDRYRIQRVCVLEKDREWEGKRAIETETDVHNESMCKRERETDVNKVVNYVKCMSQQFLKIFSIFVIFPLSLSVFSYLFYIILSLSSLTLLASYFSFYLSLASSFSFYLIV
jgi:hypothetical protein